MKIYSPHLIFSKNWDYYVISAKEITNHASHQALDSALHVSREKPFG